MVKSYPEVKEEYKKAVLRCKRKLRGLIAEKHCAPIVLRLAYEPLSSFQSVIFFRIVSIVLLLIVAAFVSCSMDCL